MTRHQDAGPPLPTPPAAPSTRWQEAARIGDAAAQQQRIEQLRQEMSTAAGAAAAAKAALVAAKAAAGAALKQHRAALEAERDQQQQQEQTANAEKVQEVAAGREKARRAQVCSSTAYVGVLYIVGLMLSW